MSRIARKLLVGVAATGACLSMFSGLACAEEEKPTANLTVGAYSQYIWRGFELSKDSLVIQPKSTPDILAVCTKGQIRRWFIFLGIGHSRGR